MDFLHCTYDTCTRMYYMVYDQCHVWNELSTEQRVLHTPNATRKVIYRTHKYYSCKLHIVPIKYAARKAPNK